MIFSNFDDFCGFHANHISESLIFLREYWFFCDLLIFAKIMIFTQNWNQQGIINFHILRILLEKLNFAENGPKGTQKP